ncbi:MAG: membrane protein insertase YidC [Kofleriaceae bacterium]|nr:membrane protein insertase YidC [Kofleriaceae bacterium]
MQDQGKRLLLAVALALGVMLLWNVIFPPKKPDAPPKAAQGSGQVAVPATSPVASTAPSTAPGTTGAPLAEASRGPEQKIELDFPHFRATFSSYGGVLSSFQLADKRYAKDQTKGELLPANADTGAFGVNFTKKSTFALPAKTEWKGTKVSDTEVVYTLSTDTVDIEKKYTIYPDVYLVKLVVTARVKVPAGQMAEQQLAVSSFAFQNPEKIVKGSGQGAEARAWYSSTLRGDTIYHTPIKSLIKAPRLEQGITWTGFEHPYLLAAYAPRVEGTATVDKFSSADPTGLMRTDLVFEKTVVKPGDAAMTKEIVAYLGPKNYTSLDAADSAAGFPTSFKSTIDLGWFSFIGKPLLWLLQKFYGVFGNWGIAIILLTILVKAATLYWTTKSMRSMKAMAALAPQMKALQEKYKDDRQRLQAETMALYKTHGVNPIAGCLPILMQMPVWLALYRMLSSAGELYQQPFIPGWIDDLTATDPYYILPIVLVVTMFLQARLTPATGDSRQQKFLQYGMPLMFGIMSFFFPAGLTLYIFTNTCLSALHSIYMNKFDKKSLEMAAKMKAAAEQTAKDAPKGGAKGGKPAAAKPAIDVEATESDDDNNESTADAAPKGSSGATGAKRPPNKGSKKAKRR